MAHTDGNVPGKHPKQDFQVERLAFFSDAVFAIAVTLLVIEFKVPHVTKDSTFDEVWQQLIALKGNMIALFLSYVLISNYWIRHHFLYKYIHNYNTQVVVVNIAALLPIVFLPFSTAFFAECSQNKNTIVLGMQVFLINHFTAAISIYAIYWFAVVKHKGLSYQIPGPDKVRFYEQTLLTALIFVVLFTGTLFTANMNTLVIVMVVSVVLRLAVMKLLKRRFRKEGA